MRALFLRKKTKMCFNFKSLQKEGNKQKKDNNVVDKRGEISVYYIRNSVFR